MLWQNPKVLLKSVKVKATLISPKEGGRARFVCDGSVIDLGFVTWVDGKDFGTANGAYRIV